MNLVVERIPNIEGLIQIASVNEAGGERYFLMSGRTLHIEGRLFSKYPLEAVTLTQSLSAKGGIAHGIAAVSALESYLKIQPTFTGQKVRQIMLGLSTLHSHIHHFYYELFPDYLNKTHFEGLLHRTHFGVMDLRSPDDLDLDLAVGREILSHFPQIERTLGELQRGLAMLGGKYPVAMNLIPGGVTNFNLNAALVMDLIRLLDGIKRQIEVLWPGDVKLLVGALPSLAQGGGEEQRMLCFGSLPIEGGKDDPAYYSSGVYLDGKLEPLQQNKITESYVDTFYRTADNKSLSNDLIYDLNKKNARTWIKAARYETEVMQTGALARMLVTHYGGGNVQISDSISSWIGDLGLNPERANCPAARIFALAFEGRYLISSLFGALMGLDSSLPLNQNRPFDFSGRGSGSALVESPTGGLLHEIYIEGGRIRGYRIVSPANWLLSSRDEFGHTGLVEAELNRLDKSKTLTKLSASRVLHSYYAQALDGTQ
ncbi:MAG: hypothetical protein A2527_06075 [Candidatus Lambdaproteobacteria bacterium RIFOXYD2_FULL_50_16]|uniref:Uptake hydrogenase large subunit n=1 Tax=Candidatus Lambdaproteobacteria bacterium RIFOXYD2_FULL_50_16 TaxID=1817772 RepID=A0A1F6G9G7_9PROT|nr:MAG: hypothetical protein A2527_06075 [Candidatus Lambdaproteobacteria bacterium RIFOXYD2_FULL_50_16]